jgi:hypothetical protein
MKTDMADPSNWAVRLGYGGLIPFVSLAAAIWLTSSGHQSLAATALLGYGATIVSFLGAIHWGLAMRERPAQSNASLIWGVAPSLLGWLALLLGQGWGLVLITLVLWTCFVVDRVLYPRYQLQAWLPMRLRLTLVASVSCLAGAAAVFAQLP